MKFGLCLLSLLLSLEAVGEPLDRPKLQPGSVLRLSQTDPAGYRVVGEDPGGDGILLTFPPIEQATTSDTAIRLAGRINPGREVLVNGEAVRIYPGGSFVGRIPLIEGENTITLAVRGDRGETIYPLVIRRASATPQIPTKRESFAQPLTGLVNPTGATLRCLPAGIRLLELPGGGRLNLTAREGNWLQADLGGGCSGWVAAGSVEISPESPGSPTRIGAISFDAENSRAWFTVPLPIPTRVDYLSPNELDLVFYNASPDTDTIDLGDWEGTCRLAPGGDGSARFELRGSLDCHRWSLEWLPGGYRLNWQGRPRREAGPVCLDPGHGGRQRGAVSPSGIAEKDANLALARAVAAQLKQAGVETVLTRDEDQTLDLGERIEIARREGAGLFLSLHHNSVGAGRDPLAASGYTVFYYQPPGRELAGEIHRALKEAGLTGTGVCHRSLAVIRPTDLVCTLLETSYLSNPEDEATILDPAIRDQNARAIARGILSYLDR